MATITDDMARLCGEIVSLRKARGTMITDLAQATKSRRAAVAETQAGLAQARAQMARTARAARSAFISNLSQTVGGLRRALQHDLKGARLAWATEEQRERSERQEPAKAARAKRQ